MPKQAKQCIEAKSNKVINAKTCYECNDIITDRLIMACRTCRIMICFKCMDVHMERSQRLEEALLKNAPDNEIIFDRINS